MGSGSVTEADTDRLRRLQRGGILPDGSHLCWADGRFTLDGITVEVPYRGLSKLLKRKRGLEDVGAISAPGNDPSTEVTLRSEAARVRAAVDELPHKQRLSVTLRIDDDLSFREIGEIIGSSEGSARVNYHHGIRRLRELLEP